jgi:hypothetical protein
MAHSQLETMKPEETIEAKQLEQHPFSLGSFLSKNPHKPNHVQA